MHNDQSPASAMFAGAIGGALILGSPLLALWLSFFVLGRIGPYGQFLQTNSSPFVALLPALLTGALLLTTGWWFVRQGKSSGRLVQGVGASVLVFNLLAGWFLTLLIMPRFNLSQVPFDKAAWDASDCYNDRTRQRMLVNLRETLRGKNREQVLATIGQPSDGRSSYCLGPEAHIIPVDREFMQPTFNAQGQLVDLKVTGS